MKMPRHSFSSGLLALAVGAMLIVGGRVAYGAETARSIPEPALDEALADGGPRTIVLAGGCFWGVQGIFQHTNGVINAVSGYSGGDKITAEYEKVSSGSTGH